MTFPPKRFRCRPSPSIRRNASRARPQPQKARKEKGRRRASQHRLGRPQPVPYLTPSTGVLGAPPPPYAGGQVATGGRLGMLGNRSVMDTPFNQTSYTAQADPGPAGAHARRCGDERSVGAPGVECRRQLRTSTHIRGFYYENGDIVVERPLRHGAVLLDGREFRGARGSPERSERIAERNAARRRSRRQHQPRSPNRRPTFRSRSSRRRISRRRTFGTLVDMARRFGDHKEFGVRFNGGYRNGKTRVRQPDRRIRQRRAEPGLSRRTRARLGRYGLPGRRSFRAAALHQPSLLHTILRSATAAGRVHLRLAVVGVLEAERQVRDGARRGRYHRQHHRLWRTGMAPHRDRFSLPLADRHQRRRDWKLAGAWPFRA